MKRVSSLVVIAMAGFVLVSGADRVDAQAPQKPLKYSQRYAPRRPTLSPYLDYFRRDVGLTDPYHAYIRPRRQLNSQLRTQQALLNRQGQDLRRVNDDLRQFRGQRFRGVTAAPTGTGSTFMNYSHYYSSGGR